MRIIIENNKISIFLSLLDTISKFNSNTKLIFEENRLYSQGMDTYAYELSIPKDFFLKYEYKYDYTKIIFINNLKNKIKQLISLTENAILLSLEYNMNVEKLYIKIYNTEEDEPNDEFEISLIDEDYELLNVNNIDSNVIIVLDNEINKQLGIHLLNGSNINFSTIKIENKILFYINSNTEDNKYKSCHSKKEIIEIHNDEINVNFSSKSILNNYKCKNATTKFYLSNTDPLIILHELKLYNIFLKIYISPKIDDDDESHL